VPQTPRRPRRRRESATQQNIRLGLLPSGPDPVHASRLPPTPIIDVEAQGASQSSKTDMTWRRGWDSNPRSLAGQRFSRPPQSTTLSPLHVTFCIAQGHGSYVASTSLATHQLLRRKHHSTLAEREGFEPSERFPAHSLSKRAQSATLSPLRTCVVRRPPLMGKPTGHHRNGAAPLNPPPGPSFLEPLSGSAFPSKEASEQASAMLLLAPG
jgi:hypothetical protein